MSSTTDRRTIDVDLRDDVGGDVPPEMPRYATIEIKYRSEGKTVRVDHGQDEWVFEFEDGDCVDRDPPTRPVPKYIGQAMGFIEGELR
jgi:hypothetical protein